MSRIVDILKLKSIVAKMLETVPTYCDGATAAGALPPLIKPPLPRTPRPTR